MKNIGSFMALLGIAAIVMNYLDRVPRLLMWIYNWGDTVAWTIKIGLVVVGGALYFLAPKEVEEIGEESAPAEAKEE
jgi:hypothetical protein